MKTSLGLFLFVLIIAANGAILVELPSTVTDLTPNGVMIGQEGQKAYLWDSVYGRTDFDYLPGAGVGDNTEGTGISIDGSVVVGTSTRKDGATYLHQAFTWTRATGMQAMVSLAAQDSTAVGLSLNGHIAAGTVTTTSSTQHAVLWTDGVESRRLSAGTSATALSRNGLWMGGSQAGVPGFSTSHAFIWSAATGVEWIATGGPSLSAVYAVTDDGNVALGTTGLLGQPFRWTRSGGLQLILGSDSGFAAGLNGDGSIVVGSLFGSGAFYWTTADGLRLLEDVLEDDYSFDLTGWELTGASAISEDGKTIFGYGQHNGEYAKFVATVPEPSAALFIVLGAAMQLRRRRSDSRIGKAA